MSKLERITVTLPEAMAARLRDRVEAGEYATTSEIVREALRDWADEQERRAAGLARIRGMIAEGEASESLPAEAVFAELRAYAAELASRHDKDAA